MFLKPSILRRSLLKNIMIQSS